jgi:hypothetical protein
VFALAVQQRSEVVVCRCVGIKTKEAKREYQHAWIEVAIKWRIRAGFYGRIFEARRRNNQSKELILRAQSKDYHHAFTLVFQVV